MRPLVSVIIPVYNVEEYLQECLDSVLTQSYSNIEIICVDDCGTDGSMHIVEDFSRKDRRIKIIHHEHNKGLGPARNTGMEEASGEYILFLDSDDMLYPDSLQQLVDNAQKTKADVVAGRVIAFPHIEDDSLKTFAESYNEYDAGAPSGVYRLQVGEVSSPCCKLSVVSHGRLFSTSFLKDRKLLFIDGKIAHEDNGFYCKYMSCLPLVSITDIATIQYRIRPGSIMTGLDSKAFRIRRERHMKLVLDDARSYICSQNKGINVDHLLFTIGCLESPPFLIDYESIFQLKWGKFEKLIRFLNMPIYKTRITSKRKLEYSILGIIILKRDVKF